MSISGKDGVLVGSFGHFAKDMESLLNNAEFSDVKFLVGPQKVLFQCHKCILAARCRTFKEMFQESTSIEESIVLTDTNPILFKIILQFIYCNSCNINPGNVMHVLLLAMEYGLNQLVEICEQFISESVTIETACHAMQAAVTFGLDSLKRALLPYFEQHTKDIFTSKEFNELSNETLTYLLQSDELNMDEYEILMSVKGWAMVNSVALGYPTSEIARPVVCNLRLPLLSSQELEQVESENANTRFIPVEQISMAWKHIALKTPYNTTLETTPRKGTFDKRNDK